MSFIESETAPSFDTARMNINVGNVLSRSCKAKEDPIIGVNVKFGWTGTRDPCSKERSKDTKMREIRLSAIPSLGRFLRWTA